MIFINNNIHLNEDELQFSATKASGPGGQHVNATNSSVHLKFNAKYCPALTQPTFNRLKKIAGQKMTGNGIINLQVSDGRSQHRNKAIATERLVKLIRAALISPKARRKTYPTKRSVTRRLDGKTHISQKKKARGQVNSAD